MILKMFWYNATNYHQACITAGLLVIMFDTMKTAVFTRLRKGNESNIMSFINSDSWTTEGSINLFNNSTIYALF